MRELVDIEPVTGSRYPVETVDCALLLFAVLGNAAETSRQLAAQGHHVPATTLQAWRTKQYPRRFARLQETHAREIEAALIPRVRDLAALSLQVTQEALEATRGQLKAGDVKDAASAARNAATVAGISFDKLLLLTDRPNQITEHRSGDEALSHARAAGFVTDAVVVEMPALRAGDNEEEAA